MPESRLRSQEPSSATAEAGGARVKAPVGVVTGGGEGEGPMIACVGRRLGSSTHHGEPPEVARFEASRSVEHVDSLV